MAGLVRSRKDIPQGNIPGEFVFEGSEVAIDDIV